MVDGLPMAKIARDIELYNSAYRLAWKHISEHRKRAYIALLLHDSIRRQLKEGAAEPVLIASEALRDIEKLTGQIQDDESPPTHATGIDARPQLPTDAPISSRRRFISSTVARYWRLLRQAFST